MNGKGEEIDLHVESVMTYFDDDRPQCHIQPPAGWMNDPNGPILYNGKYHMFYQYLPEACEWDFGIVWGHAVSSDLVHWEHLPPALVPSPEWVDADGCFSGCCVQNSQGVPIILYTGVRLRSNHEAGPLPPPDQDLGMVWIESQCAAVPEDPQDPMLTVWKKLEAPFLGLPPKEIELTGWRDPFIVQLDEKMAKCKNGKYSMLMGSGIKGKGGTALVYESENLEHGWELRGLLCEGCADDTGVVWECPLLVPLKYVPSSLRAPSRAKPPAWLFQSETVSERLSSADLARSAGAQQAAGKNNRMIAAKKKNIYSVTDGKNSVLDDGMASDSTSEFQFQVNPGIEKHLSGELFPRTISQASSSTAVSLLAQKLEKVAQIQDKRVEEEVDKFEAAKMRVKPLAITRQPQTPIIPPDTFEETFERKQWYLFTVSPDAPTNPVLYWTGQVSCEDTDSCPKFQMDTAKGPFRLDLGDVLYAPNVCQDDKGQWLLWGWLQERRKVGSYVYAGCLTLPRILHVTDEGRLIQAPIPEIDLLRESRYFSAQHVAVYPDSVFPLKRVKGERLDIQCSIQRGTAGAAGLLFRSHEAESDGSTAIIYDWCNNMLEAIFNVPANWKPAHLDQPFSSDKLNEEGVFDPASMLCTPKFSMSRNSSMNVFSPHLCTSPDTRSVSNSPLSSRNSTDLEYNEKGVHIESSLRRTGSSLSMCLQRGSPHVSSLGGPVPSLPRMGSFLSSRAGSFVNKSPGALISAVESETVDDEDLGTLLEDLAAPMRAEEAENEAEKSEPRRVGGPLLMKQNDVLHLRIIVDHSCVEVYTGTGEVLSTRIYRGRAPNPDDPGIDFVSFGGTAIIECISAYELKSAWPNKTPTPVGPYEAEVHTSRRSFESAAHAANATESHFERTLSRASIDRAHSFFDEIISGV